MNLYLVQHGEANPEAEDPTRALSEQGAEIVRRMAAWSMNANVHADQIRHSGKLRAAQTAELFAERLKPSGGTIAIPGIAPKDDVLPIANSFAHDDEQSIMLVGHLPFLARLVSQLVIGTPGKALVEFRNAGIVCLARYDSRWLIQWSVVPDLLRSG